MPTIVRMLQSVHDRLKAYHLDPAWPRERLSHVHGTSFMGADGVRIVLVTKPPLLLGDDCYSTQHGAFIALHDNVRDGLALRFAQGDDDVLIDIHDHHFSPGGTRFSSIDDRDDLARGAYVHGALERMLYRRPHIGPPRRLRTLSIVFDQSGLDAREIGRDGLFHPVARIDIVGPRPQRIVPNGSAAARGAASAALARQQDFITPAQQAFIAEAVFGIAGCGGLGSIAAEAAFRLGARNFVLFDDDAIEAHNLNRWQGSRPGDVGRGKARLLGRRLRGFGAPGEVRVRVVPRPIMDPAAERALVSCDILLGCLDNDIARHFLNRVSIQYLIPTLDAGVNIRTTGGVDFESRYYAVLPGSSACAECSGYQLLDQAGIERGLMDELTASAKRRAGYVEAKPEIRGAASAYALNLRAVSTLMTELTNWICGYRPVATCSFEAWREGRLQRSDRANHPEGPEPGCPLCSRLLGVGPHAALPRPLRREEAARLLSETMRPARSKIQPTPGGSGRLN